MQEGSQGILNNQKSAGGTSHRQRSLCGCRMPGPAASGTRAVPAPESAPSDPEVDREGGNQIQSIHHTHIVRYHRWNGTSSFVPA